MADRNYQLNRIDRHILSILQDEARISYAELARRVGLTTTPCLERVKRLEKHGYIRGYNAILDPNQLDSGLTVFVQIRLDRTSKDNFDAFKRAVYSLPEVQECYLVSGSFDFLLKARVADMNKYRDFLADTLLSVPGVKESTSIAVMETVKETMSIAVPTD
jgi:Lrp/AsnC family leucine-responsive transcriptional regulator